MATNRTMFIGIEELYYGDPMTVAPTKDTIEDIVNGMTEIYNSHQDTFGYEQDDPEVTDYVNELTGKTYYRDKVAAGDCRMTFTMGQFDFAIRSELEGGTVSADGKTYAKPTTLKNIEKSLVGKTKTGNYVIFTNASIVVKTDTQEKALGLGVTGTAQDSGVDGVSSEYWIDMSDDE